MQPPCFVRAQYSVYVNGFSLSYTLESLQILRLICGCAPLQLVGKFCSFSQVYLYIQLASSVIFLILLLAVAHAFLAQNLAFHRYLLSVFGFSFFQFYL